MGQGFGTTQSSWQPIVDRLVAAGYRVMTFDGAGTTPATVPLYRSERHASLYGFAEDLLALLAAEGATAVSYVGHSAGGMVGLLALLGQPGLFRTLSLVGASARYIDDPATGYVGGFKAAGIDELVAAMRGNYAAWANGFAQLVVANPERPALALEFYRSLLALRPDIASEVLPAILRSDHRPDAIGVALPVQVLQTAHDPAVPLAAAEWLAEATRAEDFRVLPLSGHFPHISDPQRVGDAVLAFLERHA